LTPPQKQFKIILGENNHKHLREERISVKTTGSIQRKLLLGGLVGAALIGAIAIWIQYMTPGNKQIRCVGLWKSNNRKIYYSVMLGGAIEDKVACKAGGIQKGYIDPRHKEDYQLAKRFGVYAEIPPESIEHFPEGSTVDPLYKYLEEDSTPSRRSDESNRVTTGQESPFHSAILNSIPNPFRQKQHKRVVVMETADRAAYYDVGQSVPVGNGYNLCKEHFNAMTPQEFDAILANGGIVVGSPSDIRENSMRVSQSVLGFGNLKCQMRDYIIEQ
jgi:hypothetical protein